MPSISISGFSLAAELVMSLCNTPLLLRYPLPAGLVQPVPFPPPPFLSYHSPGAVICLIQDVGVDGKVTNVATLYRRRVPLSVALEPSPDETGYQHPATLNGKPISVRLIHTFLYGVGAKVIADKRCSWAAYDRWRAINPSR